MLFFIAKVYFNPLFIAAKLLCYICLLLQPNFAITNCRRYGHCKQLLITAMVLSSSFLFLQWQFATCCLLVQRNFAINTNFCNGTLRQLHNTGKALCNVLFINAKAFCSSKYYCKGTFQPAVCHGNVALQQLPIIVILLCKEQVIIATILCNNNLL